MFIKTLFDRHYADLVQFLYGRLGDRDQAEDIAQEAFVRMYEHSPRHPRAWLHVVAANLARDAMRGGALGRRLRRAVHSVAVLLVVLTVPPLAAQQQDTTRADAARADSTAAATLRAPSDTGQRVRLTPVVITGTRLSPVDERTPVQVDEINMQHATPGPGAAIDALRNLPGVSLFDDQGTQLQPELNVRGFIVSPVVGEPQGVSVFLDGVRINEPDAQEVNFDLIPMDAVRNAELVRGPSSLFGKNTLAGALLLFTDRGQSQPELNAELEGGAFGYRGARITGSGMAGGFDGYVMARFGDEDGWRQQTGSRTRMLFTTVGHRGDSSDLALSVLYAHDRIREAGSLPESYLRVSPRLNYTGGDYFQPDLWHVALRGRRSLAGGTFRGNAFFRDNDIEQFNGNIPLPNTDGFVRNLSAGTTLEWTRPVQLGARVLSVTMGGEYEHDDVKYRFLAVDVPHIPADSAESASAGCDPISGVCTRVRVRGDNAALYAQGILELTQGVALTAAVRGDYVRIPYRDLLDPGNDGTSSYTRVSPRVGLNYQLTSDIRGYVALNTGFRAPAALELACASAVAPCSLPSALGADPLLRPVTVYDYETGLDWEPAARTNLDAVVYWSDVHNDIVFAQPSATEGFFRNVARTRRDGLELSGGIGLPAGLRAFGSYSYVAATYRSTVRLASAVVGAAPAEPGDQFPLSPRHRGTVGIEEVRTVGRTVLDGAISLRMTSSQYLRGDEANDFQPLAGFAVTDVRLAAGLPHVRVSAHLTNLFNQRYATFGIFAVNAKGPFGGPPPADPDSAPVERFLTPGLPRAFTVSVSLTW
ncbi:MAG TPA: TonB-dependent receptor [Gemmatimonadaceae bacterium]|nr:TonB-dependent receptor [Gemmatimonadaceae bacterium]